MNQITFKSPDDMHLHVRDGEHLPFTLKCAVKQCSRAIIMPNIIPPVINLKLAMEYKSRILDSLPKEGNVCFEPLMTLYMTDQVSSCKTLVFFLAYHHIIYSCSPSTSIPRRPLLI